MSENLDEHECGFRFRTKRECYWFYDDDFFFQCTNFRQRATTNRKQKLFKTRKEKTAKIVARE